MCKCTRSHVCLFACISACDRPIDILPLSFQHLLFFIYSAKVIKSICTGIVFAFDTVAVVASVAIIVVIVINFVVIKVVAVLIIVVVFVADVNRSATW